MKCRDCIFAKKENELYYCPFNPAYSGAGHERCKYYKSYCTMVNRLRETLHLYKHIQSAIIEHYLDD